MPVLELDDWTQGEVSAAIQAMETRQRRERQNQAIIAYRHAMVVGALFASGVNVPEIYDAFPFWTDEEIKAMKLAKYKAIMERHVAAQKGSEKRGE